MAYTVVLSKGRKSVALVLDNKKAKFSVTSNDGPVENFAFGGDWPQCEGAFLEKVRSLRAQGFRPKDRQPKCRVLTSFDRYVEMIVESQKIANTSDDDDWPVMKQKFGFKSKKECADETVAWYGYLLGEPELMSKVDEAQAAVMD